MRKEKSSMKVKKYLNPNKEGKGSEPQITVNKLQGGQYIFFKNISMMFSKNTPNTNTFFARDDRNT